MKIDKLFKVTQFTKQGQLTSHAKTLGLAMLSFAFYL